MSTRIIVLADSKVADALVTAITKAFPGFQEFTSKTPLGVNLVYTASDGTGFTHVQVTDTDPVTLTKLRSFAAGFAAAHELNMVGSR
jgi:hypothetical protein